MQAPVFLTFAGDQTGFFASVSIRHELAERVLDDPALPVMQSHRGRDDATRSDRPWAILANEGREQIERMSMAEQQSRRGSAEVISKSFQAFLIDAECVQIALAIGDPAHDSRLEPPAFGSSMTPESSDALAERPTAPLVGADRTRPLPGHRIGINHYGQRHAGRTRRGLVEELLPANSIGK